MAKEVPIGLKSFYIGDQAVDGGMGIGLTKISYAVIDTPVFTIPEGTKTEFPIEDSDDPYYASSVPGTKTLAISFYGLTATLLAKWFGGTATVGPASGNDTWDAPVQIKPFEASFVAEHAQGGYLSVVRASISASLDWNFQKNNLPKINVIATVLTPTKANTAPMKFNTAAYVP